jgi:hypothetical protein
MDKGVWEMHSNFDLNVYMGEIYNETIVERKWMYMKIEENMFLGSKGVNLIADPGYGKTSIVSQLICAEHSSPWFNLRNDILAYHICRFDRSTTQNTGIFIKSLAIAIIRTFPIVGNALYFDQMFQDYMYGIQCSVDPMGCFDISRISYLSLVSHSSKASIISIYLLRGSSFAYVLRGRNIIFSKHPIGSHRRHS